MELMREGSLSSTVSPQNTNLNHIAFRLYLFVWLTPFFFTGLALGIGFALPSYRFMQILNLKVLIHLLGLFKFYNMNLH